MSREPYYGQPDITVSGCLGYFIVFWIIPIAIAIAAFGC